MSIISTISIVIGIVAIFAVVTYVGLKIDRDMRGI